MGNRGEITLYMDPRHRNNTPQHLAVRNTECTDLVAEPSEASAFADEVVCSAENVFGTSSLPFRIVQDSRRDVAVGLKRAGDVLRELRRRGDELPSGTTRTALGTKQTQQDCEHGLPHTVVLHNPRG